MFLRRNLKYFCKALTLIFFIVYSLLGNYFFILAQEASNGAVLNDLIEESIDTNQSIFELTPTPSLPFEASDINLTTTPSPNEILTFSPTPTLEVNLDSFSEVLSYPIKLKKTIFSGKENITLDFSGDDNQIKISLKNFLGEEQEVRRIKKDNQLEIKKPKNFKPGKYHLLITDKKNKKLTEADFFWGVLAINTHKSIYLPHETANIALAVLDEQGKMVCDAKLILKIILLNNNDEEFLRSCY